MQWSPAGYNECVTPVYITGYDDTPRKAIFQPFLYFAYFFYPFAVFSSHTVLKVFFPFDIYEREVLAKLNWFLYLGGKTSIPYFYRRITKWLYLGIDQHARQLTISLRDDSGDVLQARQVKNLIPHRSSLICVASIASLGWDSATQVDENFILLDFLLRVLLLTLREW